MPFPSFPWLDLKATFAALTLQLSPMQNSTLQWVADVLHKYTNRELWISAEVKQMNDFALAYMYRHHHCMAVQYRINLEVLKNSPELESNLFNQKIISDDLNYHEGMVASITTEIERRII